MLLAWLSGDRFHLAGLHRLFISEEQKTAWKIHLTAILLETCLNDEK